MPDNEANLAVHGGVAPPRGPQTLGGLWNSVSAGCLVLGVVPPRGGLLPSVRWAGGAIPHPHHHPKNKTT